MESLSELCEAHVPRIYLDIQPNTRSASGVIYCNDSNDANADIEKLVRNSISNSKELNKECFLNNKYWNLERKGSDEIHFRISVKPCEDVPVKVKSENVLSLITSHSISKCATCLSEVYDKSYFQRILPLPSAGWEEMSDSCFCHEPEVNKERRRAALQPRAKDLLVGDIYLLLSKEAILEKVKSVENAVHCKNCSTLIGEMVHNGEAVKLYLPQLLLCNREPTENGLLESTVPQTHAFFAAYIQEHATRTGCVKFLIYDKIQTGKMQFKMLLWIFDSNRQILSRCPGKLAMTAHVIKVMYIPFEPSKASQFEKWNEDNLVYTLPLPGSMSAKLLNLLQESTLSIPESLQLVGDFQIGHVTKMVIQ